MKRIILINIMLAFCLSACEPILFPIYDQVWYLEAKDGDGKVVTQLTFPAEGGIQTIYVQTTLPYWIARPTSLSGLVYTHPDADEFGYIEYKGLDGWLTVKFRQKAMGIFNGEIEVTVEENTTGVPRSDGIYIFNDDIPAFHTADFTITITQH